MYSTTETDDYVTAIWRAVAAGSIDWQEARALQAEVMPRCAPHQAPTGLKIGGKPMCAQCLREGRHKAA